MLKIRDYLVKTDPRHSDFADALAYAVAAEEASLRDEYVLLHIKPKPWWLPMFLFKKIIGKLFQLNIFKK